MKTREVILRQYPEGKPKPEDFAIETGLLDPLSSGEVRVGVEWLSMDPLPRVRMAERSPMGPPMKLGSFVEGRGGGNVIESRDERFRPGDLVVGEVGWREIATLPGDALTSVDRSLGGLDLHLGILGASGLTAFFLAELAAAQDGETVLVAPAAGSVGMVATQILASAGVDVVGLVGGRQQADFVRKLGASGCVDHRTDDLAGAMSEALPKGWDAFLDGVGGLGHDTALKHMNIRARLVLFGFISGYGDGKPPAYGNAAQLLLKRATAHGFLLADFASRHCEAREALARLVEEKRLAPHTHVTQGLEQAPAAFSHLFADAAPGKQLVKL
jgi:NADPH-dependent curcumin reductase CurA